MQKILLFLLSAAALQAAPLVSFNGNIATLTNASIPSSVAADIVDPSLQGGVTLSRGSGLTGLAFNARFGSASFSTGGEGGALSAGDFLTFTLTPVSSSFDFTGYTLTLTPQTAGAGPQFLGIYSTKGGFTAGNAIETLTLQRTGTPQAAVDIDLSSLGVVTGPLEIRFYGYGATNASGAFSVNGLSIEAAAVPEPSTVTLALGAAVLAGGYFVRFRRSRLDSSR